MAILAEVALLNTRPNPRDNLATCGVPFDKGAVPNSSTIIGVEGARNGVRLRAQWYPFGPTWDDGSIRFGRVTFPARMAGSEERIVTLVADEPVDDVTYTEHADVTAAGLSVELTLEGNTLDLMSLTPTVLDGGATTDHYRRYEYFGRWRDGGGALLTPCFARMILDVPNAGKGMRWWLLFGHSLCERGVRLSSGSWTGSPRFPDIEYQLTQHVDLSVSVSGATRVDPRIYFEETKARTKTRVSDTRTDWRLLDVGDPDDQLLHFGVSHCYKGGIGVGDLDLTNESTRIAPILAVARNWDGRLPPFFRYPDNPPYIASDPRGPEAAGRARLTQWIDDVRSRFGPSDPFRETSLGNRPDTPQAGDQFETFGAARGWEYVRTGYPYGLDVVGFSTRQNFSRYLYYVEEDGSFVTGANYPGVKIFQGYLYHQPFNGANHMGKTTTKAGNGGFVVNGHRGGREGNPGFREPWIGPDRQHASNTWEIADTFLTCDWASMEWARATARFWMFQLNPNTGNPTLDALDTPRGAGRSAQCAISALWATDYVELRDTLLDRISNRWLNPAFNYGIQGNGNDLNKHRPQWLSGKGDAKGIPADHFWYTWEEHIRARGCFAMLLWMRHYDGDAARVAAFEEDVAYVAATLTLNSLIDLTNGRWDYIGYNGVADDNPQRYQLEAYWKNWPPQTRVRYDANGGTGTVIQAKNSDDMYIVVIPDDPSRRYTGGTITQLSYGPLRQLVQPQPLFQTTIPRKGRRHGYIPYRFHVPGGQTTGAGDPTYTLTNGAYGLMTEAEEDLAAGYMDGNMLPATQAAATGNHSFRPLYHKDYERLYDIILSSAKIAQIFADAGYFPTRNVEISTKAAAVMAANEQIYQGNTAVRWDVIRTWAAIGEPIETVVNPPAGNTISPTSVGSEESVGSPTVTPQTAFISVTSSIASAESVGSPTLGTTPSVQTVTPTSIASAEAVGSPIVENVGGAIQFIAVSDWIEEEAVIEGPTLAITPSPEVLEIQVSSSIASAESVGVPSLVGQTQTIAPDSVDSAESVGRPVLSGGSSRVAAINAILRRVWEERCATPLGIVTWFDNQVDLQTALEAGIVARVTASFQTVRIAETGRIQRIRTQGDLEIQVIVPMGSGDGYLLRQCEAVQVRLRSYTRDGVRFRSPSISGGETFLEGYWSRYVRAPFIYDTNKARG